MVVVPAREEWLAREHLGQDAPNRPDVDSFCVLLEGKHDLWRTVPSGGDIFGHEARFGARRFGGFDGTCEPEVAHLVTGSNETRQLYKSVGSGLVFPQEAMLCGGAVTLTLRSQFAFRRRFEGFKSRWMTSALCNALSARRVW